MFFLRSIFGSVYVLSTFWLCSVGFVLALFRLCPVYGFISVFVLFRLLFCLCVVHVLFMFFYVQVKTLYEWKDSLLSQFLFHLRIASATSGTVYKAVQLCLTEVVRSKEAEQGTFWTETGIPQQSIWDHWPGHLRHIFAVFAMMIFKQRNNFALLNSVSSPLRLSMEESNVGQQGDAVAR